jgi:hypothetical protein
MLIFPDHLPHLASDINSLLVRFAKEAAKESLSLNEQYNVITMSDVKQAVKTSTKIKWQNRWTISESGRQLYDLFIYGL